MPAGLFITGVGGVTSASDPEVSIYATIGPNANRTFGLQLEAFGGTAGDTRVALGDVNGDGTDDVIAAGGMGSTGEVVVFDGFAALMGRQTVLSRFTAYANFAGGVHVAAADLNNDGFAEVVTTPGMGGRGHLKVFGFSTGTAVQGTSAYTFTSYNGEVRVATMKFLNQMAVVTASGAGVPGDVRVFINATQIGAIPDGTPVASQFLAARLVPFGGYSGGLSIAAGDADGDGTDGLFVAKNDGAPTIEVYRGQALLTAFQSGVTSPPPTVINNVFTGFLGPIRLGSSDTNGDGRDEILATTGFSGNPQGTPVMVFQNVNGTFTQINSFFSNPGYQPGAWLAGGDFDFALNAPFQVFSPAGGVGVPTALPTVFLFGPANPNGIPEPASDAALGFSAAGMPLGGEPITGAGLFPGNVEVSFSVDHPNLSRVTVSLIYVTMSGPSLAFRLFNGNDPAGRAEGFSSLRGTFTDNAPGLATGGTVGQPLTGRFLADDGPLAAFVAGLPRQPGFFQVLFENADPLNVGTIVAAVPPTIRIIY